MAELKPKKFGYVGPHPCPPPFPPPPFPVPAIPVGMTVHDWIHYINSYIDLRARQLYNKLKNGGSGGGGSSGGDDSQVKDYILLKDQNGSDDIYQVFIYDGCLKTRGPYDGL